MGEVEVAVLAAMVRSRRAELGLTRRGCAAAGGPPTATLTAVEHGHLHPTDGTLDQLDAALRWPPGTARAAMTEPARSVYQRSAEPLTLRQHRLLYSELTSRGADPEAVEMAGDMLAHSLRVELRYTIETSDVETLLAVEKILAGQRVEPSPGSVPPQSPAGRPRRPIPEIRTDTGSVSLRELRLNRGWSLDEVVVKLNALQQVNDGRGVVSRGTISAIETGQRGMSLAMSNQLELVYGLQRGSLSVYARDRRGRGSASSS